MLEWLITGKNLSCLMTVFGIATLVCMSALIFYKDEYRKSSKLALLSIASVRLFCGISAIGLFFLDNVIVEKSVSYEEWKQIYPSENKEDFILSDKTLRYTDGEYLGELADSIARLKNRSFIDLRLQTGKIGQARIETVRLNTSDVISDQKIDTFDKNSKIVKIEYRDIDHIDTSLLDYKGRIDREDLDFRANSQIRITFASE